MFKNQKQYNARCYFTWLEDQKDSFTVSWLRYILKKWERTKCH